MPAELSIYVTFWDTGYGQDEWMLTVRSTLPDRPTVTFSYAIVLVPGTNRWIEAHRTPGDPLGHDGKISYCSSSNSSSSSNLSLPSTTPPSSTSISVSKPRKLMGAVLLANTGVMEHVSLKTFDSFIKDSEEAMADNPVPDRITDWGPELWTTARVAQLAMAEWIVLSPAAATEFDFEFHNYNRLRDRIGARKALLQNRRLETGVMGWDNIMSLED